jgi:hypothetical protein
MMAFPFELIGTLASFFSVERITAHRRRKIGRALVQLHESLLTVVANADNLLESKPDKDGAAAVEVTLVEMQARALAETRRLLSVAPLRSILQVKWKDLPELKRIETGKGTLFAVALGAFYGLQGSNDADAEYLRYHRKSIGDEDSFVALLKGVDTESFSSAIIEMKSDSYLEEVMFLYSTPRQYSDAKKNVDKLKLLTESLRKFIGKQFAPEEVI